MNQKRTKIIIVFSDGSSSFLKKKPQKDDCHILFNENYILNTLSVNQSIPKTKLNSFLNYKNKYLN